jgi:hypothetical protein
VGSPPPPHPPRGEAPCAGGRQLGAEGRTAAASLSLVPAPANNGCISQHRLAPAIGSRVSQPSHLLFPHRRVAEEPHDRRASTSSPQPRLLPPPSPTGVVASSSRPPSSLSCALPAGPTCRGSLPPAMNFLSIACRARMVSAGDNGVYIGSGFRGVIPYVQCVAIVFLHRVCS